MSIFQYTTLANAKATLQIASTDTSLDALITMLIRQLSVLIESYTKRVFGPQTYTDILSGNGSATLALRQRPVLSVASVYSDVLAYYGTGEGAFPSPPLEEGAQNGYALEWDSGPGTQSSNGLLLMIGNCWPRPIANAYGLLSTIQGPNVGNIKATYLAGFPASMLGSAWSTLTGTTTALSTSVTGVTQDAATPLVVGMVVDGTGIPIGTTITAISGTTVTLSQAATASGSTTLSFYIPAPGDVQLAMQLLVAYVKNIGKWGAAVASASYDGASISFDQTGRLGLMSEAVTMLLAPYINQAVA